MRVGLFLDMRNPPNWRRPWAEFYTQTLAGIAHAETLGIDSVWLTEHHFFEDGYLPQPMVLAGTIAAHTKRIRIGTAVMLAPLRPAVDTAEQAALADVLSYGRIELGLGAGYRVPEFAAFGQEIGRRYALLEQRALEIRRLWEHGGVTPPPVQSRAPIWIGGHGPRAGRLAGRICCGLLSFDERAVRPYLEALAAHGHSPQAARLTGEANMILSDDPEAAWARIAPHLAYQWQTYARYGAEGAEAGAKPAVAGAVARVSDVIDPQSLRSAGPMMAAPNFDVVTPEEAIRRLRIWLGELPVETVYFWYSIAGMPDDLTQRHVELLAGCVAPALV
jgi:alkanesulfonate monooxygenase SsuD/methylene tetrahydromethanopterin reductase-like flavin-dependent oxidoreductase (luciferase family)